MSINKFLINIIKSYANNNTYLETGLSKGGSLFNVNKLNFKKLISIEINDEYIKKGKIKFFNEIKSGRIELVNEDSALSIDNKLQESDDITVIYLDAHFHGEGEKYAPLDKELESIKKNDYKKLLIIDDYFHIKKKIAAEWTQHHDAENIKQNFIKDFGYASEVPYSFKGKYNSYLINTKISNIKILTENIKAHFFSLPKNCIKFLMRRNLN